MRTGGGEANKWFGIGGFCKSTKSSPSFTKTGLITVVEKLFRLMHAEHNSLIRIY